MIELDFLLPKQNEILNELYDLTDGKIMLVGSSILKINGIIDRPIGNINLNINKEDEEQFNKINHHYKLDYVRDQNFGIVNKTYWFRHNGVVGVLFLSDHMEYDVHLINGVKLRVGKVSEIRKNKQALVDNDDLNWKKHYNDVKLIDDFYGVNKLKNLI